MNRKSKIIVSVVGIAIVLLALLGITYAYYLTRIEGNTNTNSISVTTADLKLKYDDGNGNIVENDIMPGKTIIKEFSVTNEGKSKVEGYLVVLENVLNTLTRKKDLTYTLDCKLSDSTSCGTVSETIFPSNTLSVIYTNDIDKDITHYYTLTVTYKNEPNIDQSEDMGKSFSGRINIMDSSTNPYKTGVTATDNASLVYNIINNAMTNANGTTFRLTPLSIPGQESSSQYPIGKPKNENYSIFTFDSNYSATYVYCDAYEFDEEGGFFLINPQILDSVDDSSINASYLKGKYITDYLGRDDINTAEQIVEDGTSTTLYYVSEQTPSDEIHYVEVGEESVESTLSITQDNLGTGYYFRGSVQDNYVLFNNMCFRIVRIEGDGSVKLIYAGDVTVGATNCNEVGETTGYLKDDYGDFIYPEYGNDNTNPNGYYYADYENYEGGLEDEIETWYTTKFNTDTLKGKLKTDKWCLGGNNNYGYDEDGNLYTGQELEDFYIENYYYNYSAFNRLHSSKTTSLMCENEDYVESKYGTLTSDEVVLAGGKNESNGSYYLYENAQSEYYWTLSRAYFDDVEDYAFYVGPDGGLDSESVRSYLNGVRPSVTLIPGTTITGGNGTKTNPYIISVS